MPQQIDDYAHRRPIPMGSLRPGDRIGRYIIRSKLGRGGMGVVYGAYDPVLGRRVAIKLVRHRDSMDSVEIHVDERLRREAQALARLSHPNVVSLYDVGTCVHGNYLALELMPGINLDRWLRKQLRSWSEILEVFVLAGQGLAAAHTAGIIHRDFKPTNVIVGPGGHVTVVDFGLARSAELDTTISCSGLDEPQTELLSTRLTGANVIVGTNGYMAPEQLLGLSVGPRADQFGFCVALFEALYGVRPFPGENAVEAARAFSEGQRVEPQNSRGVPAALHRALMRGLSIEPGGRYPSMDALLDALRRATARRRRIRWGWALALAATATLSGSVGAGVASMWYGHGSHSAAGPTAGPAAGPTAGPASSDRCDRGSPTSRVVHPASLDPAAAR